MKQKRRLRACGLALAALLAWKISPTPRKALEDNGSVRDEPTISYQGIDVSHHQGEVNWAGVESAGIIFAFIKATEGVSEVDPTFHQNWEASKAAGLVRGAYHYFHANVSAEDQARHFIDTVHLEAGDLPPVLDVEVAAQGIAADVAIWLETVSKAYGVPPILYSNLNFIEEHLSIGFNRYPLWIADYAKAPPSTPGDWQAWTFWQYSQTGTVNGIVGNVDRNVFRGSQSEWKRLLIHSVSRSTVGKKSGLNS